MAASITDEAVEALAAAIFQDSGATVVEAYSGFGAALKSFGSPHELTAYVRAQRRVPSQSAHLAVHYPDMGGALLRSRLEVDPEKCQGHAFRYAAAGWGLIWAHLEWRLSPVGSYISANSENRALALAPTQPELGPPEQWNWAAVGRHLRRLRRALKLAA